MSPKVLKHILFRVILPHLTIILSGMLIVLLAIDRVNSSMMFIDHRITKGMMTVLAIASIINGASLLVRPKHHEAHQEHHPHAPERMRPADYPRQSGFARPQEHTRPSDYSRPGSGRSWM